MPSMASRMNHFERWRAEHARERERVAAMAASAAPTAPAEAPAGTVTGVSCPPPAAAPAAAPPGPAATSAPGASNPAPASRPTPATATYSLEPPLDLLHIAAPGPELARQVGALLAAGPESRRRAVAFAREVMRQLPTMELADACDESFGPMDDGPVPHGPATPRGPPSRMQVALPQSQPELPLLSITYQTRCICCDDQVGEGEDGRCAALQMLATLEDDLAERERIIQQELDSDEPPEDLGDLHRAARWFMYRTFVAAQYGYLGKGCRVRIPLCVVAAIRCRFPAPGCNCTPAAIAACRTHGYVGHRDA